MGQHVLGLAAHQKASDATTPMRGHHDQVAGTSLRDIDDRLVDVVPALRERSHGTARSAAAFATKSR